MAKFMKGVDMFFEVGLFQGLHVVCVTTNGIIKANGELVMGRGVAGEAAKIWPWLPRAAGDAIKRWPHKTWDPVSGAWEYTILNLGMPDRLDQSLMLIQTKMHYASPSPVALVGSAVAALRGWAEKSPKVTFMLPFPGIGLGGLPRSLVLPWVEALPDNVIVYER